MQEFNDLGLPRPKLNPEFSQSLWYDADKKIISKKSIMSKLFEFMEKNIPKENVYGERKIKKGKQIIISPKYQFLAGLISGKIGVAELNDLHKQIRQAETEEQKEMLSNRQIGLTVEAINAVLNSDTAEEDKAVVKKLLS
ncbi:MAG: hypothetical protein HYZ51_04655 [Candidatus Doudnabacteria bacterium]|nr:hypothetical protein [Candidatus Doudnabacteria bacterium]